jgi:hypothetical protein
MNQILFEDLGNGLNLTRMVFIRERSVFEQRDFETFRFQTARRREINNAVLQFHRERELNERLLIHEMRESSLLQEIRERIFFQSIPDDFWEPVKITTSVDSFEYIAEEWECFICREERTKKTKLLCCNQSLCDSCVTEWFSKESVKCPFCKKDIREIKISNE